MTTMQDVANMAKVSAKTVSRVYNNDPHVDPDTRARVLEALKATNYVPNTIARSFRSGRAAAVGVAVPDIADPYFAALSRAVERYARQVGMAVFITSLGDDPDAEQELVESLLERQLSGLIIAPISGEHSYLKRWMDRTPTVFIDRPPIGVAADSFLDDDDGGARVAAQHLLDLGHRRIAFVGDSDAIPTVHHRLDGFRHALAENGIDDDVDLVRFGVNDRPSAEAAIAAFAQLKQPPTALFISNARATMASLAAIKESALHNLAIVGFGNFPLADVVTPSITVIDQNPVQIGDLAIKRIMDRINYPQRRYRRRNTLPVKLIVRDSSLRIAGRVRVGSVR